MKTTTTLRKQWKKEIAETPHPSAMPLYSEAADHVLVLIEDVEELEKALLEAKIRILEIQNKRCTWEWTPGALIPPGTPRWKQDPARCVLEKGHDGKHVPGKP